jgi:hypothetical protein
VQYRTALGVIHNPVPQPAFFSYPLLISH